MRPVFPDLGVDILENEVRPPAKRCAALVRDGSPCRGFAIRGDDFCVYHSSKARERRTIPLGQDETILLLSQAARRLGKIVGPGALDRAKEIRSLIAAIESLQSGKQLESGEKEPPADLSPGIASRVEKWKNKNHQS
jgi:hypothetical protein